MLERRARVLHLRQKGCLFSVRSGIIGGVREALGAVKIDALSSQAGSGELARG